MNGGSSIIPILLLEKLEKKRWHNLLKAAEKVTDSD